MSGPAWCRRQAGGPAAFERLVQVSPTDAGIAVWCGLHRQVLRHAQLAGRASISWAVQSTAPTRITRAAGWYLNWRRRRFMVDPPFAGTLSVGVCYHQAGAFAGHCQSELLHRHRSRSAAWCSGWVRRSGKMVVGWALRCPTGSSSVGRVEASPPSAEVRCGLLASRGHGAAVAVGHQFAGAAGTTTKRSLSALREGGAGDVRAHVLRGKPPPAARHRRSMTAVGAAVHVAVDHDVVARRRRFGSGLSTSNTLTARVVSNGAAWWRQVCSPALSFTVTRRAEPPPIVGTISKHHCRRWWRKLATAHCARCAAAPAAALLVSSRLRARRQPGVVNAGRMNVAEVCGRA